MFLAQLLLQFAFRVTFGLALAMAILPGKLVTAGFFRTHLWVLLGLNTLASLVFYSRRTDFATEQIRADWVMGLAVCLGVLSYVGSVIWLYEQRGLGKATLWALSLLGLVAAVAATPLQTTGAEILQMADLLSSGFLLGMTLAAMFLGHWYLNTPTMQLAPLRRLVVLMAVAIALRAVVSGCGLAFLAGDAHSTSTAFWIFISFRWLTGILAASVFVWMTWHTLKIPNTQSATGILYAGVVVTFLGELMSQLLSVHTDYPV